MDIYLQYKRTHYIARDYSYLPCCIDAFEPIKKNRFWKKALKFRNSFPAEKCYWITKAYETNPQIDFNCSDCLLHCMSNYFKKDGDYKFIHKKKK